MAVVFGSDIGIREDAFSNFNSSITSQLGRIKDGIIACRKHDWRYDLHDGNCQKANQLPLKTYAIEQVDDEIYLLL